MRAATTALAITAIVCCVAACTNPFAPAKANLAADKPVLGDQRTIDGVFQNFRIAYVFKDTLTYGRLLDRTFSFIYRNYDAGVDVTWGRDEDMIATAGLFNAAQQLDLVWNEVIVADGDSLAQNISRGFNLTITFSPTDIIRAQGRVNLRLERPVATDVWKIVRWRDESNFF
ncbi:MAG: hypothetical protein BGO89_05820 [Candidatus Kapaibacterium thiocyanatum]|uniref:SnoaL-like domain-containing protein n=1 Tax=Candidatus Kapaibacterium thiocyanatum TaxID=1895771 RepID=A0A1M3L372_9BACT|nr:MAG: hypothetical protein BGO89_05820 ['Candidatus Kapabacteria' thiocyanatum]